MSDTDNFDGLLAVARAGAGVNNITIDKASAKGICVFNTPGANANAVAELVMTVLGMAVRNADKAAAWVKNLDVNDPAQIHQLAHTDGSKPAPQKTTKAVVGPGTGMGVGFLAFDGEKYIPASSEGGHSTFAPFDKDSQEFHDYMEKKIGMVPGVEPLVSGMGLRNMYEWWKETRGVPDKRHRSGGSRDDAPVREDACPLRKRCRHAVPASRRFLPGWRYGAKGPSLA